MSENTKAKLKDVTKDIIEACVRGERHAQYVLYNHYKDYVFTLAYRMNQNLQDAEDVTQKIFIRIFHKIDTYKGDSAFSSWIYRIATNLCINHYRSNRTRKSKTGPELDDNLVGKNGTNTLAPHLEKAVSALPPGYRMVFLLHDVQGFNHGEVAEMMEISEGTSKSQLHKARQELRRRLAPFLELQSNL